MRNDPSGYLEAIAEIPRGQLSERQQRIAAGIAMIRDGKSCNKAAKEVGIPYSTLFRHKQGLTDPNYEKAFQKGEKALIEGHLAIATLGAEKVFERVEADTMSDGDLIKAVGVSTDKLALKRGWARGLSSADEKTQDALAGALEHLRQGHTVTIEKPDPVNEAIEIDATPKPRK